MPVVTSQRYGSHVGVADDIPLLWDHPSTKFFSACLLLEICFDQYPLGNTICKKKIIGCCFVFQLSSRRFKIRSISLSSVHY